MERGRFPMSDLTVFGSGQGFSAGDLNIDGYVAAVPAFQKVYVADGREYNASINSSGYHKIDMISTILVGASSGAFSAGETVTQAISGAKGTFLETIGSGATAKHLIYRTTTTEFDTTNVVTGGTSFETVSPTTVTAPPHWLNWILTTGDFPDGGSNAMALFEGRVWMNSMTNPNQWFATRQDNPLDLDTGQDDAKAAISSQSTLAGLVGDALIGFIPYKDNYLLFGCANSFYILRGGSTGAGNLSQLSTETGLFSPDSYCWDNVGNLYIIGLTGFYKFPNNMAVQGTALDNISMRLVPNLFKTLQLNRKTDRIVLGFDKDTNQIEVSITTMDGTWGVNFNYDISMDSIMPDTFAGGTIPSAFLYVNSYQDDVSGLLNGSYDGYIRKFDTAAKSDDGEIIDSYVLFGPLTISSLIKANVKIKETHIILSEASDGLVWELYQAESNELLVSGIKNATLTPTHTGTFTGGGMQASIYEKIASNSVAILLKNSTLDTSWSLEGIKFKYLIAGKTKG